MQQGEKSFRMPLWARMSQVRQPCLREFQNYLTETVIFGLLLQSLPNVEWTQGTKHAEWQVLNFFLMLK
jgi:hypothetical protein